MNESASLIQWVAAFGLMALLVGVSLNLIFDNLPWNLIDKTRPGHKGIGIVVIIILAILGAVLLNTLFPVIWRGVKTVLFLNMEGF